MNKFEKIILSLVVLLVVAVLVLSVAVFRKKTGEAPPASVPSGQLSSSQQAGSQKNSLISNVVKDFTGQVSAVSEQQLIVDVELADFSKPKNPDKFQNANGPINMTKDDFETITKSIKVNVNDNTQFTGGSLSDIKSGSLIGATSDKSPYQADEVTAEKITILRK